MEITKKNINLGLFVIIVATLVAFASFTTYYQYSYKNTTALYQNKLDELDRVMTTLKVTKEQLEKAASSVSESTEETEQISSEYNQLKDEKDKLESDLSKNKRSLADTRAQLTQTELQLTQAQADLAAAKSEITVLQNRVDDINGDISCLKSTADADEGNC